MQILAMNNFLNNFGKDVKGVNVNEDVGLDALVKDISNSFWARYSAHGFEI